MSPKACFISISKIIIDIKLHTKQNYTSKRPNSNISLVLKLHTALKKTIILLSSQGHKFRPGHFLAFLILKREAGVSILS